MSEQFFAILISVAVSLSIIALIGMGLGAWLHQPPAPWQTNCFIASAVLGLFAAGHGALIVMKRT